MKLVGYTDRLSVEPGQAVNFMVSSQHAQFAAELVRLIHGDENPAGPGFKAERLDSSFGGEYAGREHELRPGSFAAVPDDGSLGSLSDFTFQLWFYATTPEKPLQTLLSRRTADGAGFALRIENGRVVFVLGAQSLRTKYIVKPRTWYFAAVVHEARTGRSSIVLEQESGVVYQEPGVVVGYLDSSPVSDPGELLIGAEHIPDTSDAMVNHFYNGKIDGPKVFDRPLAEQDVTALRNGAEREIAGLAVASWDFSLDISKWTITDISPGGHHGHLVNKPMRGTTGHNWDGGEPAWPHASQGYGAIHFHDDDLADAGWPASFSWSVPADQRSGVYAARLHAGEDEDYLPVAVVPLRGEHQSQIALVLPTFSYLAYGNEHMAGEGGVLAGKIDGYPQAPEDRYIAAQRLLSLYDRHRDGSGVCHSSWLRPVVNIRPKYRHAWLSDGAGAPHQLAADLHIVDWLEHDGYQFDVVTDLELHREGAERLKDYRVVLTGSHAEYWSGEMLDGVEDYLESGGRLLNLSGNVAYWVTQLDPDTGTSIEVRRCGPAQRSWDAAPGEARLGSTGELGGIWRYRGRSPQSLLGVGFTAEGLGPGRPFVRQAGSFDERARFVFAGIAADEPIGDLPSLVNQWGAAGFEIDRADSAQGTPDHALILATADGYTDAFQAASEEVLLGDSKQGGTVCDLVRADMVLLEYPNGGAVFSTGSITWCACLSFNTYDNNVSRVTSNVLDGFLQDSLPV